jgi:hypothetical protein
MSGQSRACDSYDVPSDAGIQRSLAPGLRANGQNRRRKEVVMPRKIAFALVVALLLPAVPAVAADGDGTRISGRLLEVRPDGKLVIEEQGPWKGPGTGLVQRTVDLTPGTAIRIVRPSGRWSAGDAMPGYAVQPADFTALTPGEMVTVTLNGPSMAASIDVARMGSEGGYASPPMEALGRK